MPACQCSNGIIEEIEYLWEESSFAQAQSGLIRDKMIELIGIGDLSKVGRDQALVYSWFDGTYISC